MVGLVSYRQTDRHGHVQRGAQALRGVSVRVWCVCGVFAPAFTPVSFQPLHIWCGSRAGWGLAAVVGRLGGRKKAEKGTNQAREGSVKGRGL